MIITTVIDPNAESPLYKACLHGQFSLPIDRWKRSHFKELKQI